MGVNPIVLILTIVQGTSWNMPRLFARRRSTSLSRQWNVSLMIALEEMGSLEAVLRGKMLKMRNKCTVVHDCTGLPLCCLQLLCQIFGALVFSSCIFPSAHVKRQCSMCARGSKASISFQTLHL